MKNNEKGRSMVEMLGVLAIIGVLSMAGLAGYQKAMSKHKINKTIDQMVQIVNNIRTTYAKTGQTERLYQGINTQQAYEMGMIPPEMIVNNTASAIAACDGADEASRAGCGIQNVYKGAVSIQGDEDGESFEVIFDGLPEEVSVTMAAIDWGTDDPTGLMEVQMGNDADE